MVALASRIEIFPDAGDKVANTPEAREYLARVADDGAKYAQTIAPVRTGAYRDSIKSASDNGARPGATVSVGTAYWTYLEYGTIHNRPFRVLTNTLTYMANKTEFT
jgi:HK97 gp10 family phage protein